MSENNFQSFVNASCAHPQLLKGRSIFAVSLDGFVCGECSLCFSFRKRNIAVGLGFFFCGSLIVVISITKLKGCDT